MSARVMAWAWERKEEAVSSPSAQLLLVLIADFAGELGDCWPAIATLAAKSKQSAQSVRRRLAELEEAGLIARIARHRENGARTSDTIVVLFCDEAKAHADKLRAKARGAGDSGATGGDTPPLNLEGGALPTWKGAPSNCHKAPLPTVEGAYIEPPLNLPMNLPPNPQGGEGERGARLSDDVEASRPLDASDAWRRFHAAWPWEAGGESVDAARRAFERLSTTDRELCAKGAEAFQPPARGRVCAAVFIRERHWSFRPGNSAKGAPQIATPGGSAGATRRADGSWFLRPDSPQLAAWKAYERRTRPDGRPAPGCTRPSEWPPGHVATQATTDRADHAAA